MYTHRRKGNLKPMKIAKLILRTETILWHISVHARKLKAPVQTYRNHTIYFSNEGQKYFKKHITIIMKELGISLISSK